jgi:hypothetical protein
MIVRPPATALGLGLALVLGLGLGPCAVAHAGGGGSSTGSSSDGSSASGTTSEGTSESTGTSEATSTSTTEGTGTSEGGDATSQTATVDDTGPADTSDGGCGSCPTGDASIAFDTPTDGATVDAPFPVVVDIVPRCPCYDCSCAAEDFEYAQLFLDTVAWAVPCYASPCTWEVTVSEVDEFLLTARAHYPSGDASTSVVVNVASFTGGSTGDAPSTPSDDGPDPTSGPAGTAPAKSDDGCGCTTDGSPVAAGLLPMCLLWVARTRRR